MLLQVLVANGILDTNEVDGVEGGDKLIEKYKKLSKTRKLFKSQKLAKSRKKLLKNKNLPHFDAKENGPSFLTLDARTAFNHLWLTFTKTPILWHFDLECYIQIETNALGYVIGGMLS